MDKADKSPKKDTPLTPEEITEAAEQFFPLFNIVNERMPEGATTKDALYVMESVAKLAHKLRADKKEDTAPFGFNKEKDTQEDSK